ncbi:MAG TPA: HlyD family secretion protein [Devosiaceae bacterium]|nr:HlyD family secretion protein [Devosiaceae bacterium]
MSASDNSTAEIRNFPKKAQPGDESAPREAARAEAPTAPAAAPVQTAPASPPAPKKAGGRRRAVMTVIALIAIAAGAWYGYGYYTVGRFMVSTDDAYVGGQIATISPKVAGYVTRVNVLANQTVKAGDPLVTLDNGDYVIARDQAQAAINTQNLTLQQLDAQIVGAKASVLQAQAQKISAVAGQHDAQLAEQRARSLTASAFGTQATLDDAVAALDQANATVAADDAAIAAASANVDVLTSQRAVAASQVKTDQLALDQANRNLRFTVLRAPYDGVIGNLSVQQGDYVTPGVNLAGLVPTEDLYVDANYKETQLGQLLPGEKALIYVDAHPDQPIEGTVQSVSPASGAVFSLLPPENATGNFTKVVQRVPVRIALPKSALDSGWLRAGLSVTVDADTRTIPAMAN